MPAHTLAPLPLPCDGRSSFLHSWTRLWRALAPRFAGSGVEVFSVRLDAGHELQFREAAGWTVVCRGGAVWITQEADARDIFLKRGEGFALDRRGLALVRACGEATLSVRAPAGRGYTGRSQQLDHGATVPDDRADLVWLRSLYPGCGPWDDPASYRPAGLL